MTLTELKPEAKETGGADWFQWTGFEFGASVCAGGYTVRVAGGFR